MGCGWFVQGMVIGEAQMTQATVQLTGLTPFQMAVYASHDIVSSSVSFRHNWEQLDVRRFGMLGNYSLFR
jgi:hypothetical protein